jgi:hypothetical protein
VANLLKQQIGTAFVDGQMTTFIQQGGKRSRKFN